MGSLRTTRSNTYEVIDEKAGCRLWLVWLAGGVVPRFCVPTCSRSNPKASTHLKIEKNENMRAPAAQNRARLPATVLYSLRRRPQRSRPHQHIRIHAHTSDGMPLSKR